MKTMKSDVPGQWTPCICSVLFWYPTHGKKSEGSRHKTLLIDQPQIRVSEEGVCSGLRLVIDIFPG